MTDLPAYWTRSYKRHPRLAYARNDGVTVLRNGPSGGWTIHRRLGEQPVGKRPELADAIAWADDTIEREKQCNKCREYWPANTEFFYTDRKRLDGLRHTCKACTYEYPSARRKCPGIAAAMDEARSNRAMNKTKRKAAS